MDLEKWFESGDFPDLWRFEIMIMSSLPTQGEIDRTMGPALDWCIEQFGPAGPTEPTSRWFYHVGLIWLTDPVDATAFKVRWC
ncbi:MAG: hypothetical protein EOP84_27845 [Verrucomicrobiaceae bacterium]|nr:MAG: hypothetical protein EOP84_27845 [Verrucomicrobiaceae bacterium]